MIYFDICFAFWRSKFVMFVICSLGLTWRLVQLKNPLPWWIVMGLYIQAAMQKEWTVSLMLGANCMPRCVYAVDIFRKGASVRVRKTSRYFDDLFFYSVNVIPPWRSHRDVVFWLSSIVMYFCFVEILGWSCCKPSPSDSTYVQGRSLGRRGKIQIHGQCFCSGVQWKVNRFIKYKWKYCLSVCSCACLWIQALQLNKTAFDWGPSSFDVHFCFESLTFVMGRESSSESFYQSQGLKPICIFFFCLACSRLVPTAFILLEFFFDRQRSQSERNELARHTRCVLVRRVSSCLWVC